MYQNYILDEYVYTQPKDQFPCYLAFTNATVEKIVRENLHCNRHVTEELSSGPRYCPSLESKILRFGSKVHQIWLEPEGINSDVMYPNGLSCTLPESAQKEMIQVRENN